MTANIHQQVVHRQRHRRNFSHHISATGNWQVRPLRQSRLSSLGRLYTQRGSVTHSTITVVFSVFAIVAVAGLGFFYLQQVLGTASQGTDIQALESQVVELREQQRALELEGASLRSIQAVEERVKQLNLVATDRVAYLAETADKVAVAR